MHALLERLSDLFAARDAQAPNEASEFEAWRSALANSAERVLREAAFEPRAAHHEAQLLASHALRVATDPIGRWLLQPHAGGASETTWQHWDADGHLRTLRVDRSFLAGETAGSTGEDCLWIVDYKTGSRRPDAFAEDAARATWLTEQKLKWAPQLEAYGAALRHTGSAERPLRYGLYFPELLAFKCWHE
ncbi:PD-(D/E)XK nuclease family protein [Acidipila sp. EB88]|uniref:PD-(D/E)XK nuclease family protein n=1 Tax=Acidipila sp. EB88 TaxID=2305226 RepID=UPI001F3565BC|nr:PD-(D/E)XK nuclease family protein [Acidipila sp. EB88]